MQTEHPRASGKCRFWFWAGPGIPHFTQAPGGNWPPAHVWGGKSQGTSSKMEKTGLTPLDSSGAKIHLPWG